MYGKVVSSNYLIYWKIRFTKIFAFNSDLFASIKYFDDAEVEFKFDSDIIIGTDEYFDYLYEVLGDYIYNNKCFSSRINDYKNNSDELKFIYCKNERFLYEELYSSLLPTIFLVSNEFNYTFELNSDDLLIIKDEYIYLRILFSDKGNKVWKLGKIFSMKYKFVFNPQTKQVGFYTRVISSKNITKEKSNKALHEQNNSNKSLTYKIFIIICLFILLSFLMNKYYKIICNMTRQKRKNEIILINDYKYYEKNNVKEMESLNNEQ